MDGNFELLSVSEVARLEKKSIQTIYNRIRFGMYETVDFKRGSKMRGMLVKYPKNKLSNYGK